VEVISPSPMDECWAVIDGRSEHCRYLAPAKKTLWEAKRRRLPNYERWDALSETSRRNWVSEKGRHNEQSLACPKSYDLRPFVSSARTVSFSIDYVFFAGFWAGSCGMSASSKSDYPLAQLNFPH
jgi:hypothetical protein